MCVLCFFFFLRSLHLPGEGNWWQRPAAFVGRDAKFDGCTAHCRIQAGRKMAKVGHKAKVVGRTVAKALAAGPTVAREAGQTAGKALAAAGLTASWQDEYTCHRRPEDFGFLLPGSAGAGWPGASLCVKSTEAVLQVSQSLQPPSCHTSLSSHA